MFSGLRVGGNRKKRRGEKEEERGSPRDLLRLLRYAKPYRGRLAFAIVSLSLVACARNALMYVLHGIG